MWLSIVVMTVPPAVLMVVRARVRSPTVRRLTLVGIGGIWLYSVWSAVILLAWLGSPPGIGAGNWLELGVALVIAIGLPVWALMATGRRG